MNELYSFVLEYLIMRQAWNLGFLSFSKFKRIISYATGIHNIYYLRKIFIHLQNRGFFQKKKNLKRSYTYKFIGEAEVEEVKKVNFN